MTDKRKIISDAYNNAGSEFLAYRLTQVFAKIETQNDIALHNDVMREIDLMVQGSVEELLKDIADRILLYSRKGL